MLKMNSKNKLNDSNPKSCKIELKMNMNNLDEQNLFKLEDESVSTLREITKLFQAAQSYTEKEVNQILKEVYDDHITLRRFLIEYGFLERKPDGSQYWKKKL